MTEHKEEPLDYAALGICDECGGQFSDLEGHKSLGVQTHPWLTEHKGEVK